MAQQSEYMSYADVAPQVRRAREHGALLGSHAPGAPSYKLGRHRRFRRSDVEKWAADRVDAPEPAA